MFYLLKIIPIAVLILLSIVLGALAFLIRFRADDFKQAARYLDSKLNYVKFFNL